MRACLLLGAMLILAGPTHAECRIWRIERDASGIALASGALADGDVTSLPVGDPAFIAPVIAVAEGQSGGLYQPDNATLVEAHCEQSVLTLVAIAAGSPPREIMSHPMAVLAGWRVSLSIIGHDGSKARWRLDRWSRAVREDGPVQDLFQGKLPIPPGGYVVTTSISTADTGSTGALQGEARVRLVSGYPLVWLNAGGKRLRAVLDTAAALTIVRKDALPDSAVFADAVMEQSSAHSAVQLPMSGAGAGGTVTGFSSTTLSVVDIGTAHLEQVRVLALDDLPVIDNAPIDAILGLDILRMADSFALEQAANGNWRLQLGANGPGTADHVDADLAMVDTGALFALRGAVGNAPAYWIPDTGSPHSVLPTGLAERANVETGPPAQGRGLDGASLALRDATVPHAAIGDLQLTNVGAKVGNLPILAKLGQGDTGLLGGNVLFGFRKIEFDFKAGRVRLSRH